MDCPNCNQSRSLSPREQQVYGFVIQGKTNKEIAAALFVEVKTIKFHLTNILKKKRAKSRFMLIAREAAERAMAKHAG